MKHKAPPLSLQNLQRKPQRKGHLGFTTQLVDFLDHVADACASRSNLIYGGFHVDAGVKHSPTVPVEALLSLEPINAWLKADSHCASTQVLPWTCAATAAANDQYDIVKGKAQCKRAINWKLERAVRQYGKVLAEEPKARVGSLRGEE